VSACGKWAVSACGKWAGSAGTTSGLGSNGYGTRAQTALRFSLANPEFACVVIGLAELAHLEEALAAQAMGPLPAEAIAKLEPVYARGFN
jgi:aryl-alcohol dehydrogenase-like predicted oxidoreductase